MFFFFFSSRRRHTRCYRDWSSDVCSSDLENREQRTKNNKRGACSLFFVLCSISLAMTDVTIGEPRRVDLILLHQPLAQSELIGGRLPIHVIDLLARPQILLRRTMAVEAPLHRHRLRFVHPRHLVDPPVAGRASNPL